MAPVEGVNDDPAGCLARLQCQPLRVLQGFRREFTKLGRWDFWADVNTSSTPDGAAAVQDSQLVVLGYGGPDVAGRDMQSLFIFRS